MCPRHIVAWPTGSPQTAEIPATGKGPSWATGQDPPLTGPDEGTPYPSRRDTLHPVVPSGVEGNWKLSPLTPALKHPQRED